MKLFGPIFRNKILVLYIVVIAIVTFLGYRQLFHVYFASDEWLYIGGVHTDGITFLLNKISWVQMIAGIRRPIGTLIQNYFYLTFPNNPIPFVVFGLTTHIANCLLIFIIVRRVSKKTFIAFLSGVLFAASSVYVQSLGWIACLVEVPGSTVMLLGSLYALLIYIERKKRIWLVIAFALAYISFLIKDANIFDFLFIPLVLWVYRKEIRIHLGNVILAGMAIVALLALSRVGGAKDSIGSTLDLTLDPQSLTKALFHSFYYPLIGISQILIPSRLILRLSGLFAAFEYGPMLKQAGDLRAVSEFVIPDVFLVGASLMIFFVFVWLVKPRIKDTRPVVVAVVLYFFSFLPVAFYLTQRGSAFIESRYMYLPALALSILLAYAVYALHVAFHPKKLIAHVTFVLVIGLCLTGYIFKQTSVTRTELYASILAQQEVRNVAIQLARYKKDIPDKPIFYITSDVDFYYHFNNKIPFQEGTGYMLAVLFYDTGKIPASLIQQRFLIGFGDQGYQSIGNRGFGYFWNIDDLMHEFQTNEQLDTKQIVAFSYKSKEKVLVDTSNKIRYYIASKTGR